MGVGKKIFNAAKLVDEFHGCLFAHTRTTRYVVGSITHQS